MSDPVVFKLSTIDQSVTRVYIRNALCFPCGNDAASVERVSANLAAALKRAISYLPALAGTVHPIPVSTTETSASGRRHTLVEYSSEQGAPGVRRPSEPQQGTVEQHGRLEVRVTLKDVNEFSATFKAVRDTEFTYTYDQLAAAGMPPMAFIGGVFNPLPDTPELFNGGAPAFAVQANFISGGVVVALYLHHSVAGFQGVASIMRLMAIPEDMMGVRQLTYEVLQDEGLEQSRFRDRLSGSRGFPAHISQHPVYTPLTVAQEAQSLIVPAGASACRVLCFSLKALSTVRDLAHENLHFTRENPTVQIMIFDCLIAIVWKAIVRACSPRDLENWQASSALVVPVDIRKKVDPFLDASYYANSDLYTYSKATVLQLTMPFDVTTIANTAYTVRRSIQHLNEPKIRSAIAIINEREDVRSVNRPCIDFERDVFMTNWADLPVGEEATLGLGLGPAEYIRKVSMEHVSHGCVLLPVRGSGDERHFEVVVQLPQPAMERLCEDPGLKPFLARDI